MSGDKKKVIVLFDVDGTLSESRRVGSLPFLSRVGRASRDQGLPEPSSGACGRGHRRRIGPLKAGRAAGQQ